MLSGLKKMASNYGKAIIEDQVKKKWWVFRRSDSNMNEALAI